jgi:hypothetical protein
MSFPSLEPQHIRQLAADLRRSRRSVLAGAGSAGLLAAVSGLATTAQSPEASPVSGTLTAAAGYKTVPQVFASDFNFDFLIGLGFTYERAADIGECFAAASQIEDGNYES